MGKLMRTEDVAEMLGMPAATLRYWRHTGVGPKSFRLGAKRVVYREDDVLEWVQQQYDAEHTVAS